ncbi:subtilisin-like protease SBT1.9 [Citrus sinensis]|uniref:Subtilisin-like protease SBT1.9 n=1 Tax=Citrus sinensis TaxID=2711 RepID=A0ACB8IF22_CITSI|nr:subtilisin-like protease SBT1.9 [Citrus sinensis]
MASSGFGNDIIVGVLHTGLWPESDSFEDEDMPPVPDRWRGTCEVGVEFNASHCNRKLIGARSFSKGMKQYGLNISTTDDYDSPRDFLGHGTHTSSTAPGSCVQKIDSFGYAKGTAIGVAPMARIAMYKIMFFSNGSLKAMATDILAGMDQAMADGVDVLSLSIGFPASTFDTSPIATRAFAALKKGIFVECSAGNLGPDAYSIFNGALGLQRLVPELLTESWLFAHNSRKQGADCKYIFCAYDYDGNVTVYQQFKEVQRIGAAGAVFSSDSRQYLSSSNFSMPFVTVNPKDGELVKKYIINTENASVSIKFQITKLGTKRAPQVAYFSSRGPDSEPPWILKPDILAPGVDILAAWVPNRPVKPIRESDYLFSDYALMSGTSISCPHVAGIAALLKAMQRDWSSAAIRSAMMTTAYLLDNANSTITDIRIGVSGTPLDFGSGHVNPNKAMDPGLVYDIEVQDYINYLCALNYTSLQIRVLTGTSNFTCENANLDLNYPSFMIILNNTKSASFTFKWVLTNVDDTSSVNTAAVKAPAGMKVVVQPETATFDRKYSKAEFNLTLSIDLGITVSPKCNYLGNFGYLTWHENIGKHMVRSPIVSAFANSTE